MGDSGGKDKSKINPLGVKMQKVKTQRKNQKFSLSACQSEISGKMHYSLCAFAPLCLSALFSGSRW